MFYSPSSNGFYHPATHGEKTVWVDDPKWVRPEIQIPDPDWVPPENEPDSEAPLVMVPDMDALPDQVEVKNPNCKIPDDAVEITETEHRHLMAGQATGKQIQPDDGGRPVLVEPTPAPVEERRKLAKQSIDEAAGRARSRFVSPGSLIDAEYIQAESAAQRFADSGYSGEVPASVQSWADVGSMTAHEAADDILGTALQWRDILDQVRAIRLSGKAAVDLAPDGGIEATAQSYIDQLDAMKPA